MINNLFVRDIIHRTKIQNIYVFSPTFKTDPSFSAFRNYMYKNLSEKEIDDQIYDDINIDKLLSICEKQKSLKEEND